MRTLDAIAADARPGPAFSNSTSFEIWAAGRGCYTCRNDGLGTTGDEPHCPILTTAICDGTIPAEWTTETDDDHIYGNYTCTEYDERPDDDGGGDDDPEPEPGPPPVIEGQLSFGDLFGLAAR
jgi:hypothetical protein